MSAIASKIPVRVVSIKDYTGTQHIEIMLDVDSYLKKEVDIDSDLRVFKKQYLALVSKAKELVLQAHKKNRKGNATIYWMLAVILYDFLEDPKQRFRITNYRKAFERELDITDSVIGILLDFAKFFAKEEIDDRIPIGLYYEIVRKARKIRKVGRLESTKKELIQMAIDGNLPDAKRYRQMLELVLR